MWGFTVHQQIHDGLCLASHLTKQDTINESVIYYAALCCLVFMYRKLRLACCLHNSEVIILMKAADTRRNVGAYQTDCIVSHLRRRLTDLRRHYIEKK
jgi:hypothetical protein